jgi:Flp pilus assembly CpaF family ATPase
MNGFEMILPFLKPIEHLILDDTVSEVMVNGSDHVFIEKDGFLQQIRGLSLGEKSLMIAVKNIARRLGDDISEAKPAARRKPGRGRHSTLQFERRHTDHPQIQCPPLHGQ